MCKMPAMPAIITLAHQKGGVGKSTTTLNLYSYFASAGIKVVIVDIDPQGSISAFVDFVGGDRFQLIRRGDFSSFADLLEKVQGFELVIIDTPPYLSQELIDIVAISNLVIIPCKASLFDALAIRQTIEFIEQEKKKRDFLSAILLTMVISGASLQAQTREHLETHNIPIFKTELGNRVAYAKSLLITGDVLHDDGSKAKEEIESLAGEILNLIKKI
jgi:chromosome partitioning protein